jgi:hypothetical protein
MSALSLFTVEHLESKELSKHQHPKDSEKIIIVGIYPVFTKNLHYSVPLTLMVCFIIPFLLGYIYYTGKWIQSDNSSQTYIVHFLHFPHCLSPSAPSPHHLKQFQEIFSSVSYRYMKSINHILSP